MPDTVQTSIAVPTYLGRGELIVTSLPSAGAGLVGLGVAYGNTPPLTTAHLHLVDLCAVLAGAFSLKFIGPEGAPLGDEFSWTRRRITLATDGTFMPVSHDRNTTRTTLRAMVPPATVGVSPRGNPTVTPVNGRVFLSLTLGGGFGVIIDPRDLIEALMRHGLVGRFNDWAEVLTRHERPALPAFEVWPNQRTVPLAMCDRN